jgi:hypothetical protein
MRPFALIGHGRGHGRQPSSSGDIPPFFHGLGARDEAAQGGAGVEQPGDARQDVDAPLRDEEDEDEDGPLTLITGSARNIDRAIRTDTWKLPKYPGPVGSMVAKKTAKLKRRRFLVPHVTPASDRRQANRFQARRGRGALLAIKALSLSGSPRSPRAR